MKDEQIKLVAIRDKRFKKQLLISSAKVQTLKSFLKDLIKSDVMVINTNVGLDIYYLGNQNHDELVWSAFLLLGSCNGCVKDDFYVKNFNSEHAISTETKVFFEKLLQNPLLMKSYSRSFFTQLNDQYSCRSLILEIMIDIWKNALLEMDQHEKFVHRLLPFVGLLQHTQLRNNADSVFHALISRAISSEHHN